MPSLLVVDTGMFFLYTIYNNTVSDSDRTSVHTVCGMLTGCVSLDLTKVYIYNKKAACIENISQVSLNSHGHMHFTTS
jgi:hypothetical protein